MGIQSSAPELGKATMGIAPSPPGSPVPSGAMGVMAPPALQGGTQLAVMHGGIAISDVFTYLPYVYRVIENLGDITACAAKLKPYIAMAQSDFPGLIAEGKAILNEVAPNLVAGLAAQPVKFDVAWVQSALNKASSAGLTVDGKYGPMTHEAIRLYQVAQGLEPDTWAGPITVARLFKEVGANP
jgi:hypothetical protein